VPIARRSSVPVGAGTLCRMNEPEACRACGRPRDAALASALSWVCDRRPDGGTSWMCADCARAHLRAIESKLPEEWW
jgi:hypothetical protein